ncbi:MAG: ABC transporter permease [Arenicella sp.]|nr:ABC transporter permease [Arenicella sp.]
MVVKDLKVRYKQTVMGIAWAVIQPLTMMLIFSLIFGRLAKIPSDGYPYPVFVFSGLLAWNFFASSISSSAGSLIGASNLVSKVYFPRIIIPIATIGVSCIDFVISAVLMLLLMLFYSQEVTLNILFVPFFLFGLMILSIGLGSWLASITVMYRDFKFVVPYMIQIWMYLTPVLYPISFVPEKWRWLLYLNPMYGWINGIRASFLGQEIDALGILVSLVLSISIFILGMFYFEKTQRKFADII